jgi:hypothetical protein
LQSFSPQYTNGDHHVRSVSAAALVDSVGGNNLRVVVEGPPRDDSNNSADLIITAVVIAEVED